VQRQLAADATLREIQDEIKRTAEPRRDSRPPPSLPSVSSFGGRFFLLSGADSFCQARLEIRGGASDGTKCMCVYLVNSAYKNRNNSAVGTNFMFGVFCNRASLTTI
jgi:hypothetical protein